MSKRQAMIDRAAQAFHDGPLGAEEHEFDDPANKKEADWCREVAGLIIDEGLEAAACIVDGYSTAVNARAMKDISGDEAAVARRDFQIANAIRSLKSPESLDPAISPVMADDVGSGP